MKSWAERTHLADQMDVVGDVVLPVAMLPEGWGIVVVAGTGSCVWCRTSDGRTSRSGGWGPMLGDEGSAYSLAINAVRLVVRAADRRSPGTALTERLLERMSLTNPSQLVNAIQYGEWDRTRLASLAPDVIRTADEGDMTAKCLVEAQITELAECVRVVAKSLNLYRYNLPLALAGGLLTKATTYRDRLLVRLGEFGLHAGHVVEVSEPAEGALRLAANLMPGKRTV